MSDLSFLLAVSALIVAAIFLITLINTDAALFWLILAMLLSPEFALARMPGRSVVVRIDDLLLVVIFFTWLAKLAVNKQLGVLKRTPLNIPLLGFMASCIISTCIGILFEKIRNPLAALFYTLKYIEYYVLYFMVSNVVRERRQIRRFISVMLFTALCVTLYAYSQVLVYGIGHRVTAPFEGISEPNTLACYLILMIALCIGLGLHARSGPKRLVFLIMIAMMAVALVLTYSRTGYACFIVMYLLLCVMEKRYRPLLISLLVVFVLAAPTVLPRTVFERVASTFDPNLGTGVEIGGVTLAGSPAGRVVIWKYALRYWMESPIFGFGITGVGFFDSQYATLLGEQGLFGLLMLLWAMFRLFKHGWLIYRADEENVTQGLCLGFELGLAAILMFGFAANVFIITRIAEPFWFMAAMVMAIPVVHDPVKESYVRPASTTAVRPAL